jgi:hypothetical protein
MKATVLALAIAIFIMVTTLAILTWYLVPDNPSWVSR